METITESKVLLEQAKQLLSEGRLQESEAALKKVVAQSPDSSEGFYGLGMIQFKRENYAAAAVLFQNCVRLEPRNANAYYFLAECSEKQNLPDVAVGLFRKTLSIDPNHRGAQQKLQNLARDAKPVSGTNPAVGPQPDHRAQQEGGPVSSPQAGIYEYIRNDPSVLGQQTLRLIDSLRLISVTPRLSASAGTIVSLILGAFLVPFLAYQVVFQFLFSLMFNSKSRTLPAAQSLVAMAKIGAVGLGIGLLVSALIVILKVKNTKITLDKGRLQILEGIFSKQQHNIELYRVEDIEMHQTFFNRLTGDGTLILQAAGGRGGATKPVSLCGLAGIDQLRQLFEQLRNLVLLLRTGAWGKGVIY
jgi:hypothetical protein